MEIILGGGIISILVMSIGIIPLVIKYKKCHLSNFYEDKGIIIDYKIYGEGIDRTYAPIIGYNVNGKNYKITGNSENHKPKMMTPIKIVYNINNPNDCFIKSNQREWGYVFFGIAFLIMSIIIQIGLVYRTE